MDDEDRERLAGVFKGVAHPSRIAILSGVNEGRQLVDVAEDLEVSVGTLQDHVNILVREDLIFRPEESGERYRLTLLGREVVRVLEECGDDLGSIVEEVERVEAEVRDEFEAASSLPIDEKDLEKAIHTEKWERLMDSG